MTDIWFTSDTHFGHKNIIKFCNRPFKSIQEHDEILIQNWNSLVKQNDEVYHLGDFVLERREYAEKILKRLNGRIRFIRGNHDKVMKGEILKRFEWVKDYYEMKGPDKRKIVLCHYAFEVWNKSHHGSWHLHGHSHGTLKFKDIKRLDMGVDTNNYKPYSIDQIQDIMDKRGFDAP
jgi:calcineurin-like phosphoesterase family protein